MKQEIIAAVKAAGVVGAGGAGFPTHVKISETAEYVIVNGAECEPLLRVDQQLLAAEPELVVKGLEALMQVTGASHGVIALKAKYKQAVQALEKAVTDKRIKIFKLEDFFPAGDEQVLVNEVTGRVVPEGALPLKVGCVVCNVETTLNVAMALEGVPVTHTYVTISGDVERPISIRVPIGTRVLEVLGLAGVRDSRGKAVINGGPMMGSIIGDLSQPVTKTTKGLIVLPQSHPFVRSNSMSWEQVTMRAKSACIQCMMCTDLCPRNLLGHRLSPHKIMRSLNYGSQAAEAQQMALLCCECGACELYACVMRLSPRQVNARIKRGLIEQGISFLPRPGGNPVSDVRAYRKIPVKRLILRLGLAGYDRAAPLIDQELRPAEVKIPLKQHIGAPGIPMVHQGQKVEKGALIARIPENSLGANIHASIEGVVREVADYILIQSVGVGS